MLTSFQVIYSSPYSVLVSLASCTILSSQLPLKLFASYRPLSSRQQRSIVSLQLYFFAWLILVLYLYILRRYQFAGFYFLMPFTTGPLFGLLVNMVHIWNVSSSENSYKFTQIREEDEPLLEGDDEIVATSLEEDEDGWEWLLQHLFTIIPPYVLIMPIGLTVLVGLAQTLGDGSAPIIGKLFCIFR